MRRKKRHKSPFLSTKINQKEFNRWFFNLHLFYNQPESSNTLENWKVASDREHTCGYGNMMGLMVPECTYGWKVSSIEDSRTLYTSHPVMVIFFLPEQWRHFTVTVVDCYISHNYFPPPHKWVKLLIGMADYIKSTYLRDHIISILLYIIITLIGWIVWYHIY